MLSPARRTVAFPRLCVATSGPLRAHRSPPALPRSLPPAPPRALWDARAAFDAQLPRVPAFRQLTAATASELAQHLRRVRLHFQSLQPCSIVVTARRLTTRPPIVAACFSFCKRHWAPLGFSSAVEGALRDLAEGSAVSASALIMPVCCEWRPPHLPCIREVLVPPTYRTKERSRATVPISNTPRRRWSRRCECASPSSTAAPPSRARS